MNVQEVIEKLKKYEVLNMKNNSSHKDKSYEVIGVKMKDIRSLAKIIGIDNSLAIELYRSNFYEAMMLATMIVSTNHLSYEILREWTKLANSSNIINQGLSSKFLKVENYFLLMKEWCEETEIDLKYASYTFLSSYFRSEDIDKIDIEFSKNILDIIAESISSEVISIQNAMNNAVVMAGLHVPLLVTKAIEVADKIGYIMPLIAKNNCNIQSASDYLLRYKNNVKYSRVAKLLDK